MAHVLAFIKTPHGPQFTFVHKDTTYATKLVDWNTQEKAYYNYASVEGGAL